MASKPRGSDQLLKATQLKKTDLDRILALTKVKGIKVIDWHNVGQPAPDAISGTFQGRSVATAALIRKILEMGSLRPRLDVFPVGTPKPDLFNVRVRF